MGQSVTVTCLDQGEGENMKSLNSVEKKNDAIMTKTITKHQ